MVEAYDDPGVVRRTQVVDILRSVPLGVMLPIETTILLTIAIKHFDAGWSVKWLIAGAGGIGLLLAPFVTAIARRWGRPAMRMTALMSTIGGAGLLVGATGSVTMFVIGSVIGLATVNSVYPLTTSTYARNFPPSEMGRRVGWGMSLKVLVAAVFGLAIGQILTVRLELWWSVVAAAGVMMLVMAALERRMPSAPLARSEIEHRRVLPHFDLLGEDRQLRLTIIAWMMMGFGNLMLLPLRVEYLARPQYGIDADPRRIALITVVVPSAVRLVMMPVFGVVFDRLSFFASRILVNVLFAAYVAAFFTGTSSVGLYAGSAILGVAAAGGDLMWSLWVTKFAPPDRTADYMGLHTFFTGVRSFLAPLVGFAIVGQVSLSWIAVGAAVLMLLASSILVPEMRAERSARRAVVVGT